MDNILLCLMLINKIYSFSYVPNAYDESVRFNYQILQLTKKYCKKDNSAGVVNFVSQAKSPSQFLFTCTQACYGGELYHLINIYQVTKKCDWLI